MFQKGIQSSHLINVPVLSLYKVVVSACINVTAVSCSNHRCVRAKHLFNCSIFKLYQSMKYKGNTSSRLISFCLSVSSLCRDFFPWYLQIGVRIIGIGNQNLVLKSISMTVNGILLWSQMSAEVGYTVTLALKMN